MTFILLGRGPTSLEALEPQTEWQMPCRFRHARMAKMIVSPSNANPMGHGIGMIMGAPILAKRQAMAV